MTRKQKKVNVFGFRQQEVPGEEAINGRETEAKKRSSQPERQK